jgi:hypothetical protein
MNQLMKCIYGINIDIVLYCVCMNECVMMYVYVCVSMLQNRFIVFICIRRSMSYIALSNLKCKCVLCVCTMLIHTVVMQYYMM